MALESNSPFKKIGPFLPTFLILGFAIPAVLYATIMVMLGWGSPVIGSKVGERFDSASAKIHLYESPSTTAYFSKIGGNYETLLTPWRNYLTERKPQHKIVTDLDSLSKIKSGVILLPSALALSEAEKSAILTFRTKGGSVLSTWASGTRNEQGEWVGWKFLEQLGATNVSELGNEIDTRQLVLTGESPLSHSHPAGQRILMSKTSEVLLRLNGELTAGRFMNSDRVVDPARKEEGAVVYSESEGAASRSAVFAFAETTWEARPFAAHLLIDDTLKWLLHEAVVVKAAWPEGKRSAQVIQMDASEDFDNALLFGTFMQANRFPGTIYAQTAAAKKSPQTLSTLSRNFEIAYNGEVNQTFKGQAQNVQQKRLQDMKIEMAGVLPEGGKISGFRAPMEGYTASTEVLLQKSGLKHHAVDPQRSDGRLPLFAKIAGVSAEDDLIVLPRTQRDDVAITSLATTAEQVTKALIDDFDEASATGSLGWLSVHSSNFSVAGNLADGFPNYLSHVKKSMTYVWLATAGQVSDWWRVRERLKLDAAYNGKRLDFNVTVKGDKPIDGASLIIFLPQKGFVPAISGTKVGMDMPTISMLDEYRASVVFKTLKPGNYGYQTTFAAK